MAIPYSRTIIGGIPWYSVLIVVGIAAAVWLAEAEERRLGLAKDTAVDLALMVVPCGIVGARLYYVAMSWEHFADHPVSVLYVWEGGIAIYGAVIGGVIGAWLYSCRKKCPLPVLLDIAAPGLLLAQAIGRWGNYFNMEAYGPRIFNPQLQFFPLAVLIPSNSGYQWHAATFFYESLWNLCGFAALWKMRKGQREKGDVFAWYLVLYGSGRFVIEQLRQDSLLIGSLRVSQYLSLILCTVAALVLVWHAFGKKRSVRLLLGFAVIAAWLVRWVCLHTPAAYVLIMLLAGIMAVWLFRSDGRGLAWLGGAIALDAAGLLMAVCGWPVSVAFAGQIHAVLCSFTFPLMLRIMCLHHNQRIGEDF